jgi:hypothetical protein
MQFLQIILVVFPIQKWQQGTLHELNGLSASMEPISSGYQTKILSVFPEFWISHLHGH